MKYYILSGEASGDLHGSNLIKELRRIDNEASIQGWGGDLMEASGATITKHYRELAFMGFIEVIKNLPAILKNFSFAKKDISSFNPDVLVLIDYPGFNLRMAKWAKEQGYRIIYYISPQVWAWKESRVKAIKKYVDEMLVILPFEKDFYKKWEYKVHYVGHPLVQVIDDFKRSYTPSKESSKPLVALLPGSREQEVFKKLPIMLKMSEAYPQFSFALAKAPSLPDSFYEPFLKEYPQVKGYRNMTYDLLAGAYAALVTSGTATLETALFGVPQVVCYKGSPVSYAIAKRLVKIKFISLVNLIMDKEVVKELIQNDLNEKALKAEMDQLLLDDQYRNKIKADYQKLHHLLQQESGASLQAAARIYTFATNAEVLPQAQS